jgi:hypothetical protein
MKCCELIMKELYNEDEVCVQCTVRIEDDITDAIMGQYQDHKDNVD